MTARSDRSAPLFCWIACDARSTDEDDVTVMETISGAEDAAAESGWAIVTSADGWRIHYCSRHAAFIACRACGVRLGECVCEHADPPTRQVLAGPPAECDGQLILDECDGPSMVAGLPPEDGVLKHTLLRAAVAALAVAVLAGACAGLLALGGAR